MRALKVMVWLGAAGMSLSLQVANIYAQPVGTSACKPCHEPQYKQWLTTRHALGVETLPPQSKRDPHCLGCHQDPTVTSSSSRLSVSRIEGVGCEACHGLGGPYLKSHIKRVNPQKKRGLDKKKYHPKRGDDPVTCARCHTPKPHKINQFDTHRSMLQIIHKKLDSTDGLKKKVSTAPPKVTQSPPSYSDSSQ